jgi:hypothetical protein
MQWNIYGAIWAPLDKILPSALPSVSTFQIQTKGTSGFSDPGVDPRTPYSLISLAGGNFQAQDDIFLIGHIF